jgi:hypothetical protein
MADFVLDTPFFTAVILCSSNSAGKITNDYCSMCVAMADFVLDTPFFTEVLPVECSVVD